MFDALRAIFKSNPTPAMAQTIVAAQRAALFTPSFISAETRRLDPRTASIEEIERALRDCDFYWATAYPETEDEFVEWMEAACVHAVYDRFSRHGTTIIDNFFKRLPRRYQ